MAEVVEMGEVDEMHSKEEGGVVMNGDVEDVDMESQDSQDSVKKPSEPEMMDVQENEKPTENGDIQNELHDGNHDSDNSSSSSSSSSSSDDSSDNENENTAEGSSITTEKNSVENDDGTSQETVNSEGHAEEQNEDSHREEKSEVNKEESKENGHETKVDDKKEENSDKEDTSDLKDDNSEKGSEKEDNESKEKINEKPIEIHEIDDDDHKHETIELNDSGGEDGDVMIVDDGPKMNGTSDPTEIIDLDETTPEKKSKAKLKAESVTPRRSSRNINKNKSYAESDKEDTPPPPVEDSEESDIEEVLPEDPLAVGDAVTVEKIASDKVKSKNSSTIVVKDTKRLVEIASKSNTTTGRGPVPVNKPPLPTSISAANFPTVLPMAVPAQGMYPANMRATITPIPLNTSSISSSATLRTPPTPATITPSTPLLPTLTDDMFVVEAPSFIVPYVYEKPPVKDFREFVKDVKNEILERKKKEKEDKKKAKEEKKKLEEEKKKKEKDDAGSAEGDEEDGDKNKKKKTEKDGGVMDVDDDSDESYEPEEPTKEDSKKPYSYFESPLGKFFIDIGFNMVQEYVQSDLLKQQKRKRDREGGKNSETEKNIRSLIKNLEYSKGNNESFKMSMKKCEFCSFKSESQLAMAYHLETPHMKNFVYRCNFCTYEVRSPHDILFHMEAEHAVRGHLERAPAFHQCPNCPFEDNQKGKLSRHLVTCMRKFKPDRNLEAPIDWEPPAKIPRLPKLRSHGLNATAAAYQAMTKNSQYQFLSKMQLQSNAMQRGRGRPSLPPIQPQKLLRPPGMVFKQQTMSGSQVLVPTNYQVSGNQVFQVVGGQDLGGRLAAPSHMAFVPNVPSASSTVTIQNTSQLKKPTNQPSISITPLPRATAAIPAAGAVTAKPGDTSSKNSFVICEICDGYIKDLEQLRNHMQWIHKIKIHPKMIYNRPPLNCQKCQFRFFTDQGLERHLLGSHGLVTSSMQDAANKSKDSGRCPVCGRVYQWKLLNHVARDHNMTLKPAHLSYKCTVCTATFGMYKQFENHVYSAHSVVAKRVMDKKGAAATPGSSPSSAGKPLKINDEITIIPQPAKSSANGSGGPNKEAGTSKNVEVSPTGSAAPSRADRLARRNANEGD